MKMKLTKILAGVIICLLLSASASHAQNSFLTPFQRLSKSITGKVEQIALSPDNKYIAASDNSGKTSAWEIEGNKVIKQWGAGKISFLKFSLSGDLIMVSTSGEIKILEASTFNEKQSQKFSSSP